MQYREGHPQDLTVVHVRFALGILERLFYDTTFSVCCGGWTPERYVSVCLPGLDQITDCLIRWSRGS